MKKNCVFHQYCKKLSKIFLALLACIWVNLLPISVFALDLPVTSYFESFDADYYLEKDAEGGSILRVVEEITAVFPADSEEHGITRQLVYTGDEDFDDGKTLDLTATRDGKPENIAMIDKAEKNGVTYFDIRIGNADRTVSGRQIYQLEYTYRNVIDDYDDIQELYWNTNGTGWTKTIRSLTARVHFGDGVAKDFTKDVACYVGKYGETGEDRCEISAISDGVEFATTDKYLKPGENLTFALGFKPGSFRVSNGGYTLDTKEYIDYRLLGMAAIGIAAGAVLLGITAFAYYKVSEKRKYYKDYFVKPEYTPPHDLLVADMAENYIGRANGSQQVATLMEMAVHHQIEMVKGEEKGLFGKKVTVWTIRLKTDQLEKEQAYVLKILAGSSASLYQGQEIKVKSHTATTELTKLAENFKKSIETRLENAGLYEKSKQNGNKKKFGLASLGLVLGVLWFPAWIFGIIFLFDGGTLPNYVKLAFPWLIVVLLVWFLVVAFIAIKFNWQTADFDKHTMKGLEYSRYMDGLKMYIKMAEADRLKMLQSVQGADTTNAGIVKVYEKLLPYAVAFGLEKSWLEELSRYYELEDVSAPVWYVGMGAFSARDFTTAMNSINTTASSAIISSSNSGGGGSSGGGGFSGGGGGGGGGGTW